MSAAIWLQLQFTGATLNVKINRLSHRRLKRSGGHYDLELLVDHQPLLDLLEAAIPAENASRQWVEKPDAVVATRELTRSLKRSGEFHFFTCRHCRIPEDLDLPPIRVEHRDDVIIWLVRAPGADRSLIPCRELEFSFSKPEYEAAVRALRGD